MTYLYYQRIGKSSDWEKNIDARGYTWAIPGQYLHDRTLVALARKFSDHVLPKAFYQMTTFEEIRHFLNPTPEEEEQIAQRVSDNMAEEWWVGRGKRDPFEESDNDSDWDSDLCFEEDSNKNADEIFDEELVQEI
jgi:hypothetical protein